MTAMHFCLGNLPEQRASPSIAVKSLDHDLMDMSALEFDRALSEVYSGPHTAMEDFHAVPSDETLKKLEFCTKCPFAFTTNDLYAATPAASSSQSSEEFFRQDLSSQTLFL